jgi:hypothetical protein
LANTVIDSIRRYENEKESLMRKYFVLLLMCALATVAAEGVASAQTLNEEMSGLAAKLSKALVAQGFKSVAAVDFTDLQGQPTELGRYLAERVAVEIVSAGGVTMVDRANIKSILAEHKLTEEGLVNPENAKKLGQFAGVDAILIGNVTALEGIELMVKAISTDSAKIVAAGRISFPKTSDIQQLLNRGISTNAISTGTQTTLVPGGTAPDPNGMATKDIGPVRVVLKSVLPMNLQGAQGTRCSFEFTNLDIRNPVSIAINATAVDAVFHSNEILRASLLDDGGTVSRLIASNISGIGVVGVGRKGPNTIFNNVGLYDPTEIASLLRKQDDLGSNTVNGHDSAGYPFTYQFIFGSLTAIPPGQSVRVTMNFVQDNNGTASGPASKFFQMDLELVVGVIATDSARSYSLQNLTFDHVSSAARNAH